MAHLNHRVLTVIIIIMERNIAVDTVEVTKKIVAVAAVVMMMDMVVADVLAVVEVIHHLLMVLMSERHAGCIIREPSTMEHSLTHLMTGENHWSSYVVLV